MNYGRRGSPSGAGPERLWRRCKSFALAQAIVNEAGNLVLQGGEEVRQTLTSICWGGHFYCLDAITGVSVNALFAVQALLAINIHRALNRSLIALISVLFSQYLH